ncbi:MAG: AAA family ATPase, partial [Burkholderiaceae bacterium]
RAGTLQGVQLDGLACRLATFHRDAPKAAAAAPWGRAGQIAGTAKQLFDDLRAQCSNGRVPPLLEVLEAQLPTWRSAWQARRRAGAVRECHGDLHLDNLVWVDGEVIAFDCIEFDPALRWIDVMNDLAFATMDLRAHGRPDLAFRLLDQYLQASGDYPGLKVLRPYEIYRAGVRALVSQLRANQASEPATESAVDYVGCAQGLLHKDGRGARLMITHGLSGSGKSTIAGQLVEAVGAIRVRADVERKRLFGLDALQDSAAQGIDIYKPAATRRTYRRLADCAAHALPAGYPVVIDAAFLHRAERRVFQQLAAELRVPFTILHCHADPDCLRQRVTGRRTTHTDASEADIDVLERQLSKAQSLDGDEHAFTIEVDTRRPLEPQQLAARWLGVSI